MSRLVIVSPCPNCGVDAANHNKVLYNGIFIVCHSCGFGWYYNIETVEAKPDRSFSSHSAPLHTLNKAPGTKGGYKAVPSKRSMKVSSKGSTTNTKRYHNANQKRNPAHNMSLEDYNKKLQNSTPVQITNSKDPINYSVGEYSNNVYYSPISSHKEVRSTEAEKTNRLSVASDGYTPSKPHIASVNQSGSGYTPSTPNPALREPTLTTTRPKINESRSINLTPPKNQAGHNPYNKTANVVINLSSLPNTKSVKAEVTKLDTPQKPVSSQPSNRAITDKQAAHPIKITKPQPEDIIVNSNVNATTKNSSSGGNISGETKTPKVTDSSPKVSLPAVDHNTISAPTTDNKLHLAQSLPKNKTTAPPLITPSENVSTTLLQDSVKQQGQTSIKAPVTTEAISGTKNTNILPPLELKQEKAIFANKFASKLAPNIDLIAASNSFNSKLANKSSLGYDPSELLHLEEQSYYNIKNYTQNHRITDFVPEYSQVIHSVKEGLGSALQKAILTFTRLDLLIRLIAYIFIIGGAIFFLADLHHKKQKYMDLSEVHNAPYNSELTNHHDNIKLSKENDLSGARPVDPKQDKYQNIASPTTLSDDPKQIIAFEKKLNPKKEKGAEPGYFPNTTTMIKPVSLIDKIKLGFNSGMLAFKQVRQNAVSDIKIYQNGFSRKGENNDNLLVNSIIVNNNSRHPFLIKSLEVVFVGNDGQALGKRIIIANQLINQNSAIELSLHINQPPVKASKAFVFIKHKRRL